MPGSGGRRGEVKGRPWWSLHTAGAGGTREAEHGAGEPSRGLSTVVPACREAQTLGKENLVGVQQGLGKRRAGDRGAGKAARQPQAARGRGTERAGTRVPWRGGHDDGAHRWAVTAGSGPGSRFLCGEPHSSVPPPTSAQVGGWPPQSEGPWALGSRQRCCGSVLTQPCPPCRRPHAGENPVPAGTHVTRSTAPPDLRAGLSPWLREGRGPAPTAGDPSAPLLRLTP